MNLNLTRITSVGAKVTPKFLKPLAYEIWRRSKTDKSLELLDQERLSLTSQWKSIIDNSKGIIQDVESRAEREKILFLTGYGLGTHFLTIEPIVMMGLYARGAAILSMSCQAALP
ncbi:MAG: hypothetical protein EOP04_17105, partial [Proteobacteria bacterium]